MVKTVFLLWHVHEGDVKMLGVYSGEQKGEQVKDNAKTQPGFRDYPDGFHISGYRVDEPHWTEGFVSVR